MQTFYETENSAKAMQHCPPISLLRLPLSAIQAVHLPQIWACTLPTSTFHGMGTASLLLQAGSTCIA